MAKESKDISIKTTVSLKLTPAEHEKIKKLAEENERSVSFYVSLWAKEAIKKLS
jgi:hypothetical protein